MGPGKESLKARQAYLHILKNPGISYYDLAKALGLSTAAVNSYLATCEKQGWLVCEDANCLWPYPEAEHGSN